MKEEKERLKCLLLKGSEAEVMPGREVWAARRKKLFLKLEFDRVQKLNSVMLPVRILNYVTLELRKKKKTTGEEHQY